MGEQAVINVDVVYMGLIVGFVLIMVLFFQLGLVIKYLKEQTIFNDIVQSAIRQSENNFLIIDKFMNNKQNCKCKECKCGPESIEIEVEPIHNDNNSGD